MKLSQRKKEQLTAKRFVKFDGRVFIKKNVYVEFQTTNIFKSRMSIIEDTDTPIICGLYETDELNFLFEKLEREF